MKWYTCLVIAILVITALILPGCGSGQSDSSQTTSTTETTTYEGQVIVINYSATVADAEGGKWSFSPPKPGYMFLVVSFNITNHGYERFTVSQFFFTITVNGKEYDAAYVTGLIDKLAPNDLHDNESAHGNLAYEIPEGNTDFTISYKYASSFNIQWIKE
jgi:hypothetical protein